MVFGSEPEKGVTSRRIIAGAMIVPTLIILIGLGFAAPTPHVVHTNPCLPYPHQHQERQNLDLVTLFARFSW